MYNIIPDMLLDVRKATYLATTRYGKRCSIHVDEMQGESSCPHVVCTPDRLETDGEASLIPDDKSRNEWYPRLDGTSNAS